MWWLQIALACQLALVQMRWMLQVLQQPVLGCKLSVPLCGYPYPVGERAVQITLFQETGCALLRIAEMLLQLAPAIHPTEASWW